MKRKIIFVFCKNSDKESQLCLELIVKLPEDKGRLFDVIFGNVTVDEVVESNETISHMVLNKVKENFHRYIEEKGKKYENIIVAYAGDNTDLLKDNLPCDSINLSALYSNLVLTVGGDETPQQKELVQKLFIGGVVELCGPLVKQSLFTRKRYSTYSKFKGMDGFGGNSYGENDVASILKEVERRLKDDDVEAFCLYDHDNNVCEIFRKDSDVIIEFMDKFHDGWKEGQIIKDFI